MKEEDVSSHLQEEKILHDQNLARAAAAKEAGSDQEKRSIKVWQSQQESACHTFEEDRVGKEAATADDALHQLRLLHRDAVSHTGLPGPPTPTTRGFLKAAAASTPLNGKSDP